MPYYLGIDTSNYTTSCALYNSDTDTVVHRKKLLPVKKGELGLRQSDAVFHHTVQLPELMRELFDGFDGEIAADEGGRLVYAVLSDGSLRRRVGVGGDV